MENFITKLKFYFSGEALDLLERSYAFSEKAHANQRRESGEPYFSHPVQVADILLDLGMDAETISAALLHDTVEDTPVNLAALEKEFGKAVAMLVEGVTKLDKITFKSKQEEQAENFRKMFFAMAKDIRVLIIKLADRLHNMRTLSYLPLERQIAMAEETLEIYAPLASRLGMSYLKCELDDLCLKTLHPVVYENLVSEISLKRKERREQVELICAEIREQLDEMGVEGEVFGRPKHFYSIYKKMITQQKNFAEIYDLTAIRVIVEKIDQCYEILGRIHTKWRPIPGRVKDYIAMPKPNNYQSLHTTVMTSFGAPFEIQIRTHDMHRVAEYGIAAHWKYKEKREFQSDLDNKLGWLRQAVDDQKELTDPEEFLESFKIDLYSGQIFTFTPKGDVIILPKGACPIDFAYKVHAEIGNRCVGAKINGKIASLNTKLNTGDYVEILTNQNSKGPKRDWLNIVVSSSAKAKIRSFFRKEDDAEQVKANLAGIMQQTAKNKAAAGKQTGGKHPAHTQENGRPYMMFVITATGSKGLLARVSGVIGNDLKLSIKSITAVEKNHQAVINVGLEVRRGMDADTIIRKLKQIKGVKTVYNRKVM